MCFCTVEKKVFITNWKQQTKQNWTKKIGIKEWTSSRRRRRRDTCLFEQRKKTKVFFLLLICTCQKKQPKFWMCKGFSTYFFVCFFFKEEWEKEKEEREYRHHWDMTFECSNANTKFYSHGTKYLCCWISSVHKYTVMFRTIAQNSFFTNKHITIIHLNNIIG